MKNLLKKTKDFFINNWLLLPSSIVVYYIMTFNLPYYIYAPGGIENIDDKYNISTEYKSEGTYNLAYISVYKANVEFYLLSYLKNDWKRIKDSDVKYDNETVKEASKRDDLYLKQAKQNAIINSYKKADKEYIIKETDFFVAYILEDTKTDLKIGDQILAIDNNEISEYDQIGDYIDTKNNNDEIIIKVNRDDKKINIKSKIISVEGQKKIGIDVFPIYKIKTNPQIKFTFDENESGPSAGLLLTLSIYDSLIKEDLTNGFKIAGTGTIDVMGNVGEIGEVENKLASAVKGKADIFFTPKGSNYNDAKKYAKKKNYDIKIVSVSTFDEAVNYLKSLN